MKKKNYLNNSDFYQELVKSLEQDQLTKECEKMLILLVDNAVKKFYYVNLDDQYDCKTEALYVCLKNWRNYNPKFPNAFAYFTEIIKRGCAKGWNIMYKNKGQDKDEVIKYIWLDSENIYNS